MGRNVSIQKAVQQCVNLAKQQYRVPSAQCLWSPELQTRFTVAGMNPGGSNLIRYPYNIMPPVGTSFLAGQYHSIEGFTAEQNHKEGSTCQHWKLDSREEVLRSIAAGFPYVPQPMCTASSAPSAYGVQPRLVARACIVSEVSGNFLTCNS